LRLPPEFFHDTLTTGVMHENITVFGSFVYSNHRRRWRWLFQGKMPEVAGQDIDPFIRGVLYLYIYISFLCVVNKFT
jgi:hypothetical protein